MLGLPIGRLAIMWCVGQLIYANIEEEHRWLAAFFGIFSSDLPPDKKMLEVANQLVSSAGTALASKAQIQIQLIIMCQIKVLNACYI